ncbi:MAG: inorganic pyrophosphatase [Chitinophagales bacterium]|nr:inorganic pyrophosphatase [Chitinophagales bacterium]
MKNLFVLHPWHGVGRGEDAPSVVTAFIEIVPSDTVKYEVDKQSGLLKVDRPQQFSNIFPGLYGFIPRSYCAEQVADFCMEKTGRENMKGDGDPLDICVLCSVNIPHSNILIKACPIGGFRMIDRNEADDKIVAVMKDDPVFGTWTNISDANETVINRIRHYFLTYKDMPGIKKNVEITHTYDADEARNVILLSFKDYDVHFGNDENKK